MARIARVVVPGYPHHVTQRGNRRQTTFFSEKDYKTYLGLLSQQCRKHQQMGTVYLRGLKYTVPDHRTLLTIIDRQCFLELFQKVRQNGGLPSDLEFQ